MTQHRTAVPTGTRTWLDPEWRHGALAWAEAELGRHGRAVTGPAEQAHVRPWSTAIRIPTDAGPVWFKASGPGSAHEGPLLDVFRAAGARNVLLPLARHPDRPWILFEDGGATLRATRPDGTGDHDMDAWERILREYAAVQRALEARDSVESMLAAGVPDRRPDRLIAELERLLDDDVAWARIIPEERDDAVIARERLVLTMPDLHAAAGRLAASGVAASVQHDDLHGGNILVGPDGDRIFDWGDAVVAHPFGTLTTTFNSIAHHTGRELSDPVFARLRDVYTDAWTDVLPPTELGVVAGLAQALGCIGRSLSWERALTGVGPDEVEAHGDAIAGWLVELAGRLDGVALTA
ncbi:MAG: phosphotransferase [Chloroflexota bacterium]